MEELTVLVNQWASLVGFAALISVVVNVLKTKGIIKDGQATAWVAGINLVGLVVMFIVQMVAPDVNIVFLDEQAGQIANLLLVVFSYITQLFGSKLTHELIKGVPIIGKSFSMEAKG